MTKDEAQRRRWTFYEAVKDSNTDDEAQTEDYRIQTREV